MIPMTIVENGEPQATIVIDLAASETERFAAQELQIYIHKATGAALSIVEDRGQAFGNVIAVGRCRFNDRAALGLDGLAREGFRLKSADSVLSIAGADDDGTLFGAYTFLEDVLGVRWLWPGELGEVVPERDTIVVSGLDVTQEPSFRWRDRGPGGAVWGASSGPVEMHPRALLLGISRAHQMEMRLWERRTKWGGLKVYGGHGMGEIFDPALYAESHPEYYALVGGRRDVPGPDYDYKHSGQICTSNPEVVRVAVDWINAFLDRHPEYDAVHLTMNDGSGFCECDDCRALDTGEDFLRPGIDAEEIERDPEGARKRILTDRVITFVNQVAEQVEATHPGKQIMTMAYSRYVMPPRRVSVRDNVIPQYCLWSTYRFASQPLKNEMHGIAAAWARASQQTAIYEYLINGSWPSLHRHTPHLWAESLRFFQEQGIDLFQTQSGDEFGINGLDYYVLAKLLWDASLDVDAVLADFYRSGFGPAAEAVRRFHRRLEEAWLRITAGGRAVDCQSLERTLLPDYLTAELLSQCRADLDEADRLADSDAIRRRIAFYRQGLRYSELTVAAIWATRAIIDHGIDVNPRTGRTYPDQAAMAQIGRADRARARALVEAALQAWRERDDLVESLKDEFVLSYWWVVYNNMSRRFYPVPNLTRLAQALGEA